MMSALELSLMCLTSSRVHLRNPIAHPLVLRVKSVFARYSLGSLKENPYSLRAFRLLGTECMIAAAVHGRTELCGRSTMCSQNEYGRFAVSNQNLNISSSNMIDSRNSSEQSHGQMNRGSVLFFEHSVDLAHDPVGPLN